MSTRSIIRNFYTINNKKCLHGQELEMSTRTGIRNVYTIKNKKCLHEREYEMFTRTRTRESWCNASMSPEIHTAVMHNTNIIVVE